MAPNIGCGSFPAQPLRRQALRANSLRIRTGNFSSPCRELNQAITEFFDPDQGRGCRDCRAGFLVAWQQIIGGPSVPHLSLIEPAVET
ncbi:MAG: hypothetical protein WA709_05080 [Stellaceae bacterium]